MIRLAEEKDFAEIMETFAYARRFMAENGNPSQWGTTHPPEERVRKDIEERQLYVYEQDGELCGVFAFILGDEPAYERIGNGSWKSDEPYGVIHRIAGNGKAHRERQDGVRGGRQGVFAACMEFCKAILTIW